MKVYAPAEATQNPTIKVLIAGEPGAGKTRTASTWPDVLYINADGGLLSVRDRPNVRAIDVATLADIEEVKRALDQPPKVRESLFGAPVSTVVFDTLDEIARIIIRERLESEKKLTMAIQDWGYLGDTLRNMVRGFRNLEDVNVIFNVHLRGENDSDTGRTVYKAAIQGAFGDEVAGYVDMALLMQARTMNDPKTGEKKTVRFLRSFPDSQHPWVKDRSGSMPMEFPINFDDDYARICEAVFGESVEEVAAKVADVAALQAELKAEAAERQAQEDKAKAASEAERKDRLAKAKEQAIAEARAKAEKKEAEDKARAAANAGAAPVEEDQNPTPPETKAEAAPKPAKAAAKKAAPKPAAKPAPEPTPEPTPEPVAETPPEQPEDPEDTAVETAAAAIEDVFGTEEPPVDTAEETEPVTEAPEPEEIEVIETLPEPAPEPEPASEPTDDGDAVEPDPPAPVTPANGPPAAEAPAEAKLCAVCDKPVESDDYADLSFIRFKKFLCRKHFAEAKAAK